MCHPPRVYAAPAPGYRSAPARAWRGLDSDATESLRSSPDLALAACGGGLHDPADGLAGRARARAGRCAAAARAVRPDPATGGTVRIGIGGYPDSLNPGNGVLSEAYKLYELVYDTPITVTSTASTCPSSRPSGRSPRTA